MCITTLCVNPKRRVKRPPAVLSIPFCCLAMQTETMNSWRDRARSAMKDAGVTQEKLAETLDMTQGGVQHWLAGKRQPSLDDINRISAVLGVPPAWLTHGLEPEDMLDGLQGKSREVLRALVMAERSAPLPEALWASIEATLRLARPQNVIATPCPPAAVIKRLLEAEPAVRTSDFAPAPTNRAK